jgi:hypothetical protein
MIEWRGLSMLIKLSQDEHASLQRFIRLYKPTQRQKAQVLLGLAAGDSLEIVAMRVGITKDVVTELVARFAETGLAGVGLGEKPEVNVTLVRAGVGARKYRLPEGSTLDDLLVRAKATTKGQSVLVDGVIPETSLALHNGAIVVIAPAPRNAVGGEPPPTSVPSLRDDAIFEEYRDILKARRRSRAREEGSGG